MRTACDARLKGAVHNDHAAFPTFLTPASILLTYEPISIAIGAKRVWKGKIP